jgi:hypothetical protein
VNGARFTWPIVTLQRLTGLALPICEKAKFKPRSHLKLFLRNVEVDNSEREVPSICKFVLSEAFEYDAKHELCVGRRYFPVS